MQCGVMKLQVEARMQELKARQQSPFTIDKACLAQQRPGLLLTQDACQACDVDTSVVAKVSSCSVIIKQTWGHCLCLPLQSCPWDHCSADHLHSLLFCEWGRHHALCLMSARTCSTSSYACSDQCADTDAATVNR